MVLRTIRKKLGKRVINCLLKIESVESGCECDGRFEGVGLIKK
jgi:hypothetical protein